MATDLSTAREPTTDLARVAVVHAVVVALPAVVLGAILLPLWLAPIVAIVVAVAVTALRTALTDRACRDALVGAGRARADGFAMDTLADLYLERYERIRTQRSRRGPQPALRRSR